MSQIPVNAGPLRSDESTEKFLLTKREAILLSATTIGAPSHSMRSNTARITKHEFSASMSSRTEQSWVCCRPYHHRIGASPSRL